MSDLVNQPSKAPNRKIAAVIIATFLVQGVIGTLESFYPGISAALPAQEWIAALVPILAGYFVRERALGQG